MLIKCCLFVLGLIVYILILYPIFNLIEGYFFSKPNIKFDDLSFREKVTLSNKILNWCIGNIHLKKVRRVKPTLFISKRTRTNNFGSYQYYNKKITVYILKHNSLEDLCDTIIHEYVHHLQLRTSNDDIRYYKLTKLKSYWNNDYEIEARKIASLNSIKCLKSLEG